MNGAIVAVVILTGAGCNSPVEQRPDVTIIHRVPCAVIMREQSANPFKITQQANTITPAKIKAKKRRKKKRR